MIKKLLISFCATVLIVTSALAQTAVSGKVLDQAGSPIAGAAIKVKGTRQGVNADDNGVFKLTLPSGNFKLTISALGYVATEVTPAANLNITLLSDVSSLNDVVVTSLGIRKEKKQLVYAVSDVKAEQLQQKAEPDLLRALAGKVPGVDITSGGGSPGQSTRIKSRTVTTKS